MNDNSDSCGNDISAALLIEREQRRREMLRRQRRSNLRKQVSDSPALAIPHMVKTLDYAFAPYSDERFAQSDNPDETGMSGKLYIAEKISDSSDRYIVKHEELNSACNEYISKNLADKLGINFPRVILFELTRADRRNLFDTDNIVGIQYIEEKRPFSLSAIKNDKNAAAQWIMCHAFAELICNDDTIQCILAADTKLYLIDCSDAFRLSSVALMALGARSQPMDYASRQHLRMLLDVLAKTPYCVLVGLTKKYLFEKLSIIGIDACEIDSIYNGVFKRFIALPKDSLDDAILVLRHFYSEALCAYYWDYFDIMREKASEYLAHVKG